MQRNVVLLLLLDSEGRFLLQHRGANAPIYPEYWGFFGGGIEDQESPIMALRREAFEELRYIPASVEPVLTIDYNDQKTGRSGRRYCFLERCLNKNSLELHEGQGMGWFTLPEARNLKITESTLSTIEKMLHFFAVVESNRPTKKNAPSARSFNHRKA